MGGLSSWEGQDEVGAHGYKRQNALSLDLQQGDRQCRYQDQLNEVSRSQLERGRRDDCGPAP